MIIMIKLNYSFNYIIGPYILITHIYLKNLSKN